MLELYTFKLVLQNISIGRTVLSTHENECFVLLDSLLCMYSH